MSLMLLIGKGRRDGFPGSKEIGKGKKERKEKMDKRVGKRKGYLEHN